MGQSLEEQLVVLRICVAALGERVAPSWWRTQFLTDAGVASMRMLFPHSGLAASVRSTWEAARDLHDSRVAKLGRFHLFRLPVAQEYAVMALLRDATVITEAESMLKSGPTGMEEALASLAEPEPAGAADGPVLLGAATGHLSPPDVARVASRYASAFAAGTIAFPYFQAESTPSS